MTPTEIDAWHLELYQMAEKEWNKLLKEDKHNTPLGEKWAVEMDYWYNRLPKEQRWKMVSDAETELRDFLLV